MTNELNTRPHLGWKLGESNLTTIRAEDTCHSETSQNNSQEAVGMNQLVKVEKTDNGD